MSWWEINNGKKRFTRFVYLTEFLTTNFARRWYDLKFFASKRHINKWGDYEPDVHNNVVDFLTVANSIFRLVNQSRGRNKLTMSTRLESWVN